MNKRLDRLLRFWIDVEYERRKNLVAGRSKSEITKEIILEYERAGHAMRTLDDRGRVAWKASPKMIESLASAEREARDDLEDIDGD